MCPNVRAGWLFVAGSWLTLRRRPSSAHETIGFPGFPAYAAAKGGIGALVRQSAVEYGGRIRFNSVLPGAVVTALWSEVSEVSEECKAQAAVRTPRQAPAPEDVAAVAFRATEDASFATGQNLFVDGGRSATSQE
ncbi:SDR family NAD(P)-dependent oxidoreductase [Streptomyces sp. 3213.3]|uniref:SDR family NAD(P)-dependent oxidoreductase n=1 Tax=Streptomyces sp. 3213.3 TaxID=1855348 RepID=UPI001F36541F|nr:SDR family oxidoreductase [Streptomyces sp. 3213.3]